MLRRKTDFADTECKIELEPFQRPDLSGEIVSARLDVQALNLVPLDLSDMGVWNPREHYWGGAKNYLCWSI
jgi:hypothetical protein